METAQAPSMGWTRLCCRGGSFFKIDRLGGMQANSEWFTEWDEWAKNRPERCDSRHIGLAKEGAKLVA
jgi:hypothetical protein